MAELSGSDAIWIEETMSPDLLQAYDREAKGIPIGRPAEVNLRNNHTQYIFTCCYDHHAVDGCQENALGGSAKSST
ncbi:MAG: hypothetical protein Q9210_007457 [Variospora velana]